MFGPYIAMTVQFPSQCVNCFHHGHYDMSPAWKMLRLRRPTKITLGDPYQTKRFSTSGQCCKVTSDSALTTPRTEKNQVIATDPYTGQA